MFSFLLGKYVEVQFLILKETARQFSKVVVPYDIPILNVAPHPGQDGGLKGGGRGKVSMAGEEYLITDIAWNC